MEIINFIINNILTQAGITLALIAFRGFKSGYRTI